MAHTYVKFYAHIIFATHSRTPWLRDSTIRVRAHEHLRAVGSKYKIPVLSVGGWVDHVHLLIGLPKTQSLSDCVRILKSNSSRRVRDEGQRDFAWQVGFSAFSVSDSIRPKVTRYIERQEIHHGNIPAFDFLAELQMFARLHGDDDADVMQVE